MTATEIWNALKRPTTIDSIGSILNSLTKKKVLYRQKGVGPRGGYGYIISPNHVPPEGLKLPTREPRTCGRCGKTRSDHAGFERFCPADPHGRTFVYAKTRKNAPDPNDPWAAG
jgi:hypothetical protein